MADQNRSHEAKHVGHDHPHKDEGRGHDHGEKGHGHTHGTVDPSILTSQAGIRALKWSLVGLFVTAVLQAVVVWYTGSVALLADTIHNFGDAATAIPLWIAFLVGLWKPTKRFTYGYGRVEDMAGLFVVLMIFISALVAAYESIKRIYEPQDISYLWAVVAASIIGFAGNEAVAIFRIKVGKQIGSAALVADGYHARTDGFASLAVLVGAIGVWLGFPLADPIVGLIITLVILKIGWDSAKSVITHTLDGVEPDVQNEIRAEAKKTAGVIDVSEVRVRWSGHTMLAELNVTVDKNLSVEQGHDIAQNVRRELLEHLEFLSDATIHIDPSNASGAAHHNDSHE